MKKILLTLVLGMMALTLSSSSTQYSKIENVSANTSSILSTENTNVDVSLYRGIIKANIAAVNGPVTDIGSPTITYKNARNEYCREPEGKIGCVRAVGKKCPLGVYCILPKSNL